MEIPLSRGELEEAGGIHLGLSKFTRYLEGRSASSRHWSAAHWPDHRTFAEDLP